ncbi:FeoA family protein [Teretinema zuelzerae]|nr:FeoA family protein [Teretinema zuelzerae]HPO02511.1 FeoA family protein [Treponemataceae bacterium]
MDLKLKDMEIGSTGEVAGYSRSDAVYRDKLLAMGLTKGTPFKVLRVAPLGDPVEIEVRGFRLSLRKAESDVLEIRRLG